MLNFATVRTLLVLLLFSTLRPAVAETTLVFIDAVAGNPRANNTQARQTPFIQPQAAWMSPQGELYVSDGNFLVWRLRGGVATVLAGGGSVIDDSVPVPGARARLDYPDGLVGGSNGELYVSDVRHNRIRRIDPDGTIRTVAGSGTAGYSGDGGRATFAELDQPLGLAIGPNGALYIADSNNYAIRRFDPRTGLITTVAGTGVRGNSGDGDLATRAKLGWVTALAFDTSGNLYLSDNTNFVIRKIAPDGSISTVAGTGKSGFGGDGGPARQASIGTVHGLAVDSRNNLYLAEFNNARVRRIDSAGTITTYAGQSDRKNRGAENIPATDAYLDGPRGIALDAAGNLYIPEDKGNLIRKVDASTRVITTYAGTNDISEDGDAIDAPLIRPTDVAVDSRGNFYVADNGHFRVRRVDRSTGRIATIAGDGIEAGTPGATEFSLGRSMSISVDPLDRVLIADAVRQLVLRWDPATRRLSTVADMTVDDSQPASAVGDADGNVYISDRYYDVIYKVRPGSFTYLAGIEGETGFSGDDGPALKAKLNTPEGMVLDDKGGLIFCDSGNHVVRRIDLASGTITRFAGDGLDDSNYDYHPAIEASLRSPIAITINKAGRTFIADSKAHVIRVVDPDGIIYTIAGGERGYAGDGEPAVLAQFDTPLGIAAFEDVVFVCDSLNYRIRKLFRKTIDLRLQIAPRSYSFRVAQGSPAPSAQLMVLQSSYLGLTFPWKLTAPGFSGDWLWVSYLEGRAPDVIAIWVEPKGLEPGRYSTTIVAVSDFAPEVRIPIELIVDPPNVASAARLEPAVMSFTVPRGGSDTQTLSIVSPGSNQLDWRVRLLAPAPWLRSSSATGTTPSAISVTVDASSLEPGSYYAVGYIDTPRGTSLFVVSLVVSQPRASMLLDRDILTFETVEGSTRALPQSVTIYNNGTGDLNWDLAMPSDAVWVRASSARGTSSGGSGSAAEFAIDPSGLRAGLYSTTVTLRATGALNAPQLLSVRLRVRPAETPARAVLSRTAVVFRGSPGQQIPDEIVDLGSTGGRLTYSASITTESGKQWLDASPLAGTVIGSSQQQALRLQVNAAGLAEGIHVASVRYNFSDGTVQPITVKLILKEGATRSSQPLAKGARLAGCSPAKQVMVTTSLGNSFFGAAGWPITLRAEVYDDCGSPLADSTLTASFSNNDPAKTLVNLKNGQYIATWTPRGAAESVTVSIQSKNAKFAAESASLGGSLSADADPPPVLAAGGVLNAFSRRNSSLMAPGARMALSGSYFPTRNEDVQVLINGSAAKVLASASGELQIVAPADFAGSPKAAVVVKARGISTAAEIVTVVPVDPGLLQPEQELTVASGGTLTVTATGLGVAGSDNRPAVTLTAQLDETDVPVQTAVAASDGSGSYTLQITASAAAGRRQLTIKANGVASNAIPVTVQ